MNDDQMDELLREGVRDYNAPGAVPREEMWKRIGAARSRNDRSSLVARRSSRWAWPSAAVAAGLLLAAGVVIGRRMERTAPVVAPAVLATQSVGDTARAIAPHDSTGDLIKKLRQETRATDKRARALASAKPATNEPRAITGARATNDGHRPADNLAYRLVVLQHLAGTEAMITSFRTSAKRGEMDAQIAAWSRELLSTTRMLAASPATQDPVMKRLLQDLDLVIAQIVQYSSRGTNDPEELDLIEQSINRRGVITKLRGTLPVRNLPAGI